MEIKKIPCPAVSQISNFTVASSKETVCVKKAAEYKIFDQKLTDSLF
jgi:hypothetical protein